MISHPSQTLPVLALVAAVAATAALAGPAAAAAMALAGALAALVCVAFAAQSQRLRDEQRLVYRPVYARRQGVQRRVRSDD